MSNARELAERAGFDGPLSHRNFLINSAMQVSQRGDYTSGVTSFSAGYYLDRWLINRGGVTADFQHTTASPSGYGKSLKITATSTATGDINIYQMLEGTTVDIIKGQTVTLSAWVRSNTSSARLLVYGGAGWVTTPDAAHTGGGDWERLTTTFTVPTTAVEGFRPYIAIRNYDKSDTAITSGDYVEVTQVQLELGDKATPYEHRSYGDELARCQRFCYRMTSGDALSSAGAINYDGSFFDIRFPVTMRAAPSLLATGMTGYGSGSTQYRVYVMNSSGGGFLGAPSTALLYSTHGTVDKARLVAAHTSGWFNSAIDSGGCALDVGTDIKIIFESEL